MAAGSASPGLAAAVAAGIVLALVSVWMRGTGKNEVRLADVALGLAPFVVWLLVSGQISRLGFAGIEIEVKEAILEAAREPVAAQVTTVEGVLDEIEAAERGSKGGADLLPSLVENEVQALEFRLGSGGYYVGDAIRRYFDELGPREFFRYVLIFDEQGRLFGMMEKRDLLPALEKPGRGHDWFASLLNAGGRESGRALAELPGFVPGDAAVTPEARKREALARMEEVGSSILPVVEAENGRFVGVVERSRLTASLILDIAGALEER